MKSEPLNNRFDVDPQAGVSRLGCSLVLLAALLLTACNGTSIDGAGNTDANNGGNNTGNNNGGSNNEGNNNGGGTDQSGVFTPKLVADEADTLIKESMLGFYTNTASVNDNFDFVAVAQESSAVTDSAGESAGDAAASVRFSDTNVQEAGVDESDRVKIDGNVMFALEKPSSQHFGIFPVETVAIPVDNEDALTTDQFFLPYQQPVETLSAYRLAKENSETLTRLKLDLDNHSAEGMYLHKNGGKRDLVLLSRQSFDAWSSWGDAPLYAGLQTRVTWIDASNENSLNINRTLNVDGHLISSRKIDNRLILVTRYHPRINGITTPYSDDAAQDNRTKIEEADISTLLPNYELRVGDNTTTGPIVSDNRCYRAEHSQSGENNSTAGDQAMPYYLNPSVISIMTIDLNDQSTNIRNTCFIGDSETMYVSRNALYLATTQYNYGVGVDDLSRPFVSYYPPEITTQIHKFSFNGGGAPDFRGSGSVDGHLGWYPERKPFRMSEKDNNLRVVTFDENRSGSPVTLNILAEGDGANMQTLSTLPNKSRPEHIGKPGENLYASRFIGDRAYLVTFRVTDPLYVLDVSDPYDPVIAGELELPGYSDYLHPVSDDLLVGVGKDAIADNSDGWGEGRGAWYQGVKLALFDVSDSSNPFVADSRVIGKRGTDTPVLFQHHSFAWLPQGDGRNARMAMPLTLHEERPSGPGPRGWSDWTSNNMLKMEVDVAARSFVDVPDWIFESRAAGHNFSPVTLQDDRAVIGTDGGLYVIHNGSLQYGLWSDSAPISMTP